MLYAVLSPDMHDACCVYLDLDLFTLMSGASDKAQILVVDKILLQLYIAFHSVIIFFPPNLVLHVAHPNKTRFKQKYINFY
jgi:hypothetical protein